MKHYVSVLNKVSPLLYKHIKYYDYYDNNYTLVRSYLKSMNLPDVYHIHFEAKNIKYYFDIDTDEYSPWESTASEKIMTLTAHDINTKMTFYYMTFVEFIVNMVINSFSFKNVYVYNMQSAGGLNNIFIALVGKDLYEAIRISIK